MLLTVDDRYPRATARRSTFLLGETGLGYSVRPAELQTVFDPKADMSGFEILRLQSPRGALLVGWEQQFML